MPQQVLADGRRFRWAGAQPACGNGPFEGEMDDAAWCAHFFECLQGCAQNRRLPFSIAGLSQQVAQRVLNGCQARHTYSSREIRNAGQRDRAYARRFNCPLYQSHGPAADRSAWDQ